MVTVKESAGCCYVVVLRILFANAEQEKAPLVIFWTKAKRLKKGVRALFIFSSDERLLYPVPVTFQLFPLHVKIGIIIPNDRNNGDH
jgi:hypothetical protein